MNVTSDKGTVISHSLDKDHEIEVTVRAVGPDGTKQPMEESARNTIVIRGKLEAPSAPTVLAADGFLNAIMVSWTNPLNYDLDHVEVWRSANNYVASASKIADVTGASYLDTVGAPDLTYYYWVKAVNTSGVASGYSPDTTAGVSGTSLGVDATDIDDFSITATKMFTNTIILDADVWANNSPGGGSIAWNAHNVVYNGASYPITAGNTALAYIYWTTGNTTYTGSAIHPALGTTAFMIAINTGGIHTLVWNSSANMVIGTAFIANLAVTTAKIANLNVTEGKIGNLAVTNAKINDCTVNKLTSGTIQTQTIQLGVTPGAGDCYIASGKSDFTNAATGFILGVDDSDGDKPKFYIGSATKYMNWDGSALTIRGTLNADDLVAGTVTGRTVQTASSGQRAVMAVSDNTIRVKNSGGTDVIIIDDGVIGATPSIRLLGTGGNFTTLHKNSENYTEQHDDWFFMKKQSTGELMWLQRNYDDNTNPILKLEHYVTHDGMFIQCWRNTVVKVFEVGPSGTGYFAGNVNMAAGLDVTGNITATYDSSSVIFSGIATENTLGVFQAAIASGKTGDFFIGRYGGVVRFAVDVTGGTYVKGDLRVDGVYKMDGTTIIDASRNITTDIGTVDGVDISAHAANNNAHHAQSHTLDSHSNVTITNPQAGDVLTYNAAQQYWENL